MKKNLHTLYKEYAKYNLLYKQLNLPSPSVEYAWRKTKKLLENEAEKAISILLKTKKKVIVTDMGCGNGGLILRLAQTTQKLNVQFVGLDISQEFVDYGNKAAKTKHLSNISFKQVDIEKETTSIKEKSDVIICSEVLEHLRSPKKFINNMYLALNEGGYFLISTPNSKNWTKYLLFFLKSFVRNKQETELKKSHPEKELPFLLAEHEQHIFVFSHNQLKQILKEGGFSVYKTPRSTLLFGGSVLDRHPLLFACELLADSILDLLPLPQIGWDNIMFCQKNTGLR